MERTNKEWKSIGMVALQIIIVLSILASLITLVLLAYLLTPQYHCIGLDGGGEIEWWESPLQEELRKRK